MTTDPFSQIVLNQIFTISPKHPDRLISRESSWLEFKEAFGFQSLGKYIRSAGAFANAKGGYIVYGVANSPHKLIGLKDDRFDQLDPEKLTAYLNEHFDPELEWDRHLHELDGKVYGVLHFHESRNKPVICRKGSDDGKSLKEGEIYYRYKGRTQTIRYAELKELIEERRKHEQLLWFKHLKEIARVGIHEAGVFDLRSGKVSGTGGHFFIDESLLSQVSFIREGQFNERKGDPTLKIIGEARTVGASPVGIGGRAHIIKTKGIRAPDIILGLLRSEKVSEPQNYLTQICYESTAFLPFYYLLKQDKMSLDAAAKVVSAEPSTQPAKAKLLERISNDSSLKVPMPFAGNVAGQRKLRVRELLLKKQIPATPDTQCMKDMLAMIRTLQLSELDAGFMKSQMERWFNGHYAHGVSEVNHEIRRTVCYVDWLLNRPAQAASAKGKGE
jgi:Putative DNA-binding domain